MPFSAYLNSTSAVPIIPIIIWLVTSGFHVAPDAVQSGFGLSVRLSPCRTPFLPIKTSAAFRIARHNGVPCYNQLFSAATSTKICSPSPPRPIVPRYRCNLFDDKQITIDLTFELHFVHLISLLSEQEAEATMLYSPALLVVSGLDHLPKTISNFIYDAVFHHITPKEPPAGLLFVPLRLLFLLH